MLLLPLLLPGCFVISQPEILAHNERVATRYVLVVDQSSTMTGESAAVALELLDTEFPRPSLIAVTSMQAPGALIGAPVRSASGEEVAEILLCQAACLRPVQLADDVADWSCGDDVDQITPAVLDCLCGEGEWKDHCDDTLPEGLEAAAEALEIEEVALPRDGIGVSILAITDQGDHSSVLVDGSASVEGVEDELEDVSLIVLGPRVDEACDKMPDWTIDRYLAAVELTGGEYVEVSTESCDPAGASEAVAAFAELPPR
jgi:hypothetical protein